MADLNERWDDNAAGKYYIDKNCILCSLCVEQAPGMFRESEQGDHDIVYKQPGNEEEEMMMKDIVEQCPVEAIGDNGA